MSKILGVVLTAFMYFGIAGCGDSTPLPTQASASSASASGPTSSAAAYTETSAAFVPIPPAELSHTVQIASCNVDQINGQPANGVPLDHMGAGTFSGWVADGSTKTVPSTLHVLLLGARDFALAAKTGKLRSDVASGTGIPAFANSGFQVNADMDGVPIGDYGVALSFERPGGTALCKPNVRVSVQ